jgi:hypothetical protein
VPQAYAQREVSLSAETEGMPVRLQELLGALGALALLILFPQRYVCS